MATKNTVSLRREGGEWQSRSTADLDEALDWFTNAVTSVMDDGSDFEFASLAVDGVICGMIQEGGIPPSGEVIDMKAA
jgi:hypothetical protein